MARIKQSFCLGCFYRDGMDVAKLLADAKKIGYAAVEIWDRLDEPVSFEDFVKMAADAGLVIASTNGQHGTLRKGFNDPANHGRLVDEVSASIEAAAENKIPNLTVFSGNREGRDDARGIEACVTGLKRVAKLAESKGVNLNMELLNSKRNHPDYQCDHTAWGAKVVAGAASPRVKLLYDIYHMQIMEGDVIATIREHIAHIGHFHTAGNPGRGPLDDKQELYYPAICRAIADAGYRGYVAHEFEGKGDPAKLLEAAYKVCNV
jgi:hydroxypyruvate isomerase